MADLYFVDCSCGEWSRLCENACEHIEWFDSHKRAQSGKGISHKLIVHAPGDYTSGVEDAEGEE